MLIRQFATRTAFTLLALSALSQAQAQTAPAAAAAAASAAATAVGNTVGKAVDKAAAAVSGAASAVANTAAQAAPAAAAAMSANSGDASEGRLAYYGRKFAGRKTASGERFNPNAMTMAHKTLPFGTLVRVTNLKSKKSVVVRVNDRGPSTPDRVGDVSRGAAARLGMLRSGVIDAKFEVVGKAKARAKGRK